MARHSTAAFLGVMMLLLGACGSSPTVRFYDLTAMAGPTHDKPSGTTIGFGPIRFPEYLKRPQIITRSTGSRVEVAEFDRWLEPIDSALPRTVGMNVDGLLDGVRVIQFPFGAGLVDVDYRILAQVVRFDVDADGTAVFEVQWGISTGDGDNVSGPHRDEYRSSAATSSFDSKVAALNNTTDAWSRDIAEAFRASLSN